MKDKAFALFLKLILTLIILYIYTIERMYFNLIYKGPCPTFVGYKKFNKGFRGPLCLKL